jgi:hypothetical protein
LEIIIICFNNLKNIKTTTRMTTTYTFIDVPVGINFTQYTNVQRGTIFMWFFSIFFVTIVTGIRVVSGQIEVGRQAYEDK